MREEVEKEKERRRTGDPEGENLPVKMENRGFDPRTSRMLNGRSTN